MIAGVRRLLIGRDEFATVAAPLVGVLVGGMILVGYPSLAASYTPIPGDRLEWAVLIAILGGPAILAWWNDGLVVCWLLVFGPLFALYLIGPGGDPPTTFDGLYGALGLAAAAALLLGTVGFLVGFGLRWVVVTARSWWVARTAR